MEPRARPLGLTAFLLVPRLHLRHHILRCRHRLRPIVSGFRGTIGSPEKDKVAAWIYDHMEAQNMDQQQRKAIFKLVQDMCYDRNFLLKIEHKGFRERMAKLIRAEFMRRIDSNTTWHLHLVQRLRNLVIRHYREAIGAGINAPECWWCNEGIRMEQPFKMRDGRKMHHRCAAEFDEQEAEERENSVS